MVKLGAIALLMFGYIHSGAVGLATPSLSQLKMNDQECKQLTDIHESPIQMLPEPFESGCAIATPLRANSPGTLVYVLKTGMKPPFASVNRQELTVQEIETLNGLVDTGDAIRITWFVPRTIGSQQFVQSLPEETIFVAWDDLCIRFPPETVGCVESAAFRVRTLAEILVKNKERAETIQP